MRHTYRLGLVTAIVLSQLQMSAAITDTGKRMESSPRFIDSRFTFGNQARLVINEENYVEGTNKYTILDKSLNTVRTIETPQYPEVSARRAVLTAMSGPIDIHVSNRRPTLSWEGMSESEFVQVCMSDGFTRTDQVDGQTRYCPEQQWDYYYPDIYGLKYPQRYRVWDSATQSGIEYSIEYGYSDWGSTGIFGNEEVSFSTERPRPVPIYPESEECGDMQTLYVTQTLFNDDKEYEWIVPILTAVNTNYENDYERVTGQTIYATGFRVMNESGSIVAEVKYPAGYYASSKNDGHDLLIIDGKYYLSSYVRNMDSTEEFDIIYEVTRGSSSLNMIGAPIRVKVYPAAPHRGTPVEVELGETYGSRCTVAVVSMTGQTVMTRSIEPGSTHTTIDTANMQQGVYVVTVTDARGTRDATKIAVR